LAKENAVNSVKFKVLARVLDVFIILAAYFLTNSSSFTTIGQFPDFYDATDPAWAAVGMSVLFILLLLLQVKLNSIGNEIKQVWKTQLPLVAFMLFCVCSLAWSTFFLASIYELSLMLFATFTGVYLAIRYKPETGLDIILGFGIFSVLASYILIFAVPTIGRLENPVFLGAWRGIFWHRNHLGSLMALFSSLFILKAAIEKQNKKKFFFYLILFLLAAILVAGSRSATGILIFFILNVFLTLAFLWSKFRHRLARKHYIIIAVIIIILVIAALANLEFIFGLLDRSTTLTGRIPLWIDILTNHWAIKPVFGYGFGAFWNQESVRILLQTRHNWRYPVWFGDNGFLDILLNTGFIGLTIFLVFLISTAVKSVRVFKSLASPISLFPFLLVMYIFWANISYSFLLEVDQFVWMLLIIAAALSVRILGLKNDPYNNISKPQP
jgi:exopolysaccharide production protein ExoQ